MLQDETIIKETLFYHHAFLFFTCDYLSFIYTAQKTLKPSKKCFNSQDGWEKTLYLGISAEGYRRKHEMQVASKKFCWKNNRVFQTLVTYRSRNIFIMVLWCNFNFYFKISWPPPINITRTPTKIKMSDPPPTPASKDFSKIFNPSRKLEGGHAMVMLPLDSGPKLAVR